jgi:hypothetical protein
MTMTTRATSTRPGSAASLRWEYLIVALPEFPAPTHTPGSSDAIRQLTMTVLFKRPRGTS